MCEDLSVGPVHSREEGRFGWGRGFQSIRKGSVVHTSEPRGPTSGDDDRGPEPRHVGIVKMYNRPGSGLGRI